MNIYMLRELIYLAGFERVAIQLANKIGACVIEHFLLYVLTYILCRYVEMLYVL
jgi:hypothetical protein